MFYEYFKGENIVLKYSFVQEKNDEGKFNAKIN